MSAIEVKRDPYDGLFEKQPVDHAFLHKMIMVIYYVVFNVLLLMIAFDTYFDFLSKKVWFTASVTLIVINNFCQFLRYICIYD